MASRITRARVVGSAAITAIAAVTVWASHVSTPARRAASTDTTGDSASDIAAAPALHAGQRSSYALSLHTTLATENGGMMLDVAIDGTWRVLVLSSGPGETQLSTTLEVDKAQLQSADGVAPTSRAEIAAAFAKPLFVTLDGNGLVTKTRADPEMSGLAEGVVRALVGYTQFDRRALSRAVLIGTEVDSSGHCDVRYERESADHYRKRKLHYLDVAASGPALGADAMQLRVDSSNTELAFVAGRLDRLELREKLIASGTQLPEMHESTELTLRYRGSDEDGAEVLELAKRASRLAPGPLSSRTASAHDLAQLHAARARESSVSQLARKLAALPADSGAERADLFALASDVLRHTPSGVADAIDELHHERDAERTRFWIAALGDAGSPEAQAALAGLFGEQRYDANMQRDILRSLSLLAEPTLDTTELLASLAADPLLGRQAKYGLGTAANRLRARDPERSAAIVSELRAGLAAASNEDSRIDYVKALGNAGDEQAFTDVADQLASENEAVRMQALHAMRLMPPGRADELLAQQILADADYRVRMAALDAAGLRPPSEVVGKALLESMHSEQVKLTRQALYRTLLSLDSNAPYVQAALEWARDNEKDPDLRALAVRRG